MSTTVGIDPGLSGGITVLDDAGAIIEVMAMPIIGGTKGKNALDLQAISRILTTHAPRAVIVEPQQSMPQQGVASTFQIGRGFGQLEGLITGLRLRLDPAPAKTWQKAMLVGTPGEMDTKARSIMAAQRRWPLQSWLESSRCRKAHHGMTDSALIAEWGRLHANSLTPVEPA